jgi:hypothetical protein
VSYVSARLVIDDLLIRRFQTNWEQISSELVKTHPELSEGDNLGILKRKWEYMYVYAEIGFAKAYTSCHFWTFTRPVRNHHNLTGFQWLT